MKNLAHSPRRDCAQFGRGFLMGGADIIPGVSGGTVAIVLGIYQRLVTAISHCDFELLRLARGRQWRAAAEHLDLRFLVALGAGILTGVACLAKLMQYLLMEHRAYTLAVFFGLILASSVVVGQMVKPNTRVQRWKCLGLALFAAIGAYWLVGLQQIHLYDHPGYFFFCGAIAICAMILPGISGAYILWLLGAYETVASMIGIERVIHFDWTTQEITRLVAFVAGCAVGLIAFSKVLQALLTHARATTMAVLCGFMIGSLRRVWPFQKVLNPEVTDFKHRQYKSVLPEVWDWQVTYCLLLAIVALVVVIVVQRLTTQDK